MASNYKGWHTRERFELAEGRYLMLKVSHLRLNGIETSAKVFCTLYNTNGRVLGFSLKTEKGWQELWSILEAEGKMADWKF